VAISEIPAPSRLAPYAVALSGEVRVAGEELASGRFVVLHDPAGQEAWEGPTRIVVFVHAPLDPQMAVDPLLPAVGWSWLTEALDLTGAPHLALGGTVTRVHSEKFGTLVDQAENAEVEMRASWSPVGDDLTGHLCAFAEVLCTAAGLPPTAPGVVAIPSTRRSRRPRAAGSRG
jgi:hypothetical protein